MNKTRDQVGASRLADRLADALARFGELDALLYGSTVNEGRVVGDVDVWLDGTPADVDAAEAALHSLGLHLGVRIDVARPARRSEDDQVAAATRWCVHHDGLVLAGQRPDAPAGMTFQLAEDAYRASVVAAAAQLAHRADVLSRAGVDSAAQFTEAALRTWVRSMARDHEEERLIRRMSTAEQITRLETVDPELVELLSVRPWHATAITERLADRLL